MAYANSITVASGTTAVVSVPFPYLEQTDVNVAVAGVVVTQSLLVWLSGSTIQLPTTPTNGETVKVYRTTPATLPAVVFSDPGELEGADLNRALLQLLYIAQEAFDIGSTGQDELGAITDYVNTAMAAAQESATAAAASQTSATSSASAAASSATAAATSAANVASDAALVNSALTGGLIFEGNWDASAGTFPGAGSAAKGNFWRVSVGGTVGGEAFTAGDEVFALVNNASTTVFAGNWSHIQGGITAAQIIAALGFTPVVVRTGTVRFTLQSSAESTWLLFNDSTFGDASSGGSQRANADTNALFLLLYTFADADLPIFTSTGSATTRGAQGSAATAWAAHCRMSLPKAMGHALGVAGAGAGMTSRTAGAAVGAETVTLTATQQASMPVTGSMSGGGTGTTTGSFSGATDTSAVHSDPQNGGSNIGTSDSSSVTPDAQLWLGAEAVTGAVGGTVAVTVTGTISGTATGAGGSHPNVSPTLFLTAEVKL